MSDVVSQNQWEMFRLESFEKMDDILEPNNSQQLLMISENASWGAF